MNSADFITRSSPARMIRRSASAKRTGFDALAAGHLGRKLCLSVLLLSLRNPARTAKELASLRIAS